jgi:Phasin protein
MATRYAKTELRAGAQAGSGGAESEAMPFMASPFEPWLRFQADMFSAAEPILARWLDRRAEGTKGILESCARLGTCRDLGEAASIQADWFDGAMRRLGADLQALAEQSRAMTQCAARTAKPVVEAAQAMSGRRAEALMGESEAAMPHAA